MCDVKSQVLASSADGENIVSLLFSFDSLYIYKKIDTVGI